MTQTQTGWMIFVAAVGVMLGLMAGEVSNLHTWHDATTTAFVGKTMLHLSVVIGAFVGGKLIPMEQR